MPSPTALPPNNHLTRVLLDQAGLGTGSPLTPLFEQLLTDSVYTFKDDFDRGFDENIWGTAQSPAVGGTSATAFHATSDPEGWIEGTPGGEDEAFTLLYGRYPVWAPAKRCAIQVRLDIANLADLKFEFGFTLPTISPDNPDQDGAVASKSAGTFNDLIGTGFVLCYDRDHNTNLDLIARIRNSAVSARQSGGQVLASPGPFTFLLALTEGGGAQYWLNGVNVGGLQRSPLVVDSTNGTTNAASQVSDYAATTTLAPWLFVQNRAALSDGHTMRVDYIQAWQERVPIS